MRSDQNPPVLTISEKLEDYRYESPRVVALGSINGDLLEIAVDESCLRGLRHGDRVPPALLAFDSAPQVLAAARSAVVLGRKLYPVMDSDGLTLKGARLYITARDFG